MRNSKRLKMIRRNLKTMGKILENSTILTILSKIYFQNFSLIFSNFLIFEFYEEFEKIENDETKFKKNGENTMKFENIEDP